jgi:hypothetical protein
VATHAKKLASANAVIETISSFRRASFPVIAVRIGELIAQDSVKTVMNWPAVTTLTERSAARSGSSAGSMNPCTPTTKAPSAIQWSGLIASALVEIMVPVARGPRRGSLHLAMPCHAGAVHLRLRDTIRVLFQSGSSGVAIADMHARQPTGCSIRLIRSSEHCGPTGWPAANSR